MSNVSVDDFLAHYGVKGMRWGVRKDRESSSSERSSEGKKGKNFHLTKKQVAIGASALVGLATAAVIFRNRGAIKASALDQWNKGAYQSTVMMGKQRVEQDILPRVGKVKETTFPKGKLFTRFAHTAEDNIRQGAYVNHEPKDVLDYKTHWGLENHRHEVKIKAVSDVKAPSLETRFKTMAEVVDNPVKGVTEEGETLREYLVKRQPTLRAKVWARTASSEEIGRSVYGSIVGDDWGDGIGKAFSDRLIAKGYGVMSDDNDATNGLSSSAMVLLDSAMFKIMSSKKLNSSQIDNAYVMLKTIFKS